LLQIAPPEVSVITNISYVHACNFSSLEEIAWTKAEILLHPSTRLGVLSRDIPAFEQISDSGTCATLSFSLSDPFSDYGIVSGDVWSIHDRRENRIVEMDSLPVPGKHNLHNFLAAATVARYFDVSWEQIRKAVNKLSLPEKRLQLVSKNGILFLNDSYNASELSVKAALETLPNPIEQGRKIAVLGSMMELGGFSDDCHRSVGEHALHFVDLMFCLGNECRPIVDVWNEAKRDVDLFEDRNELVKALRATLREGDTVLLKGSSSKGLWKVLDEV
jgi:UDP-N-acetylmuramoyl-tripeptide--D-alanyl-D-alanine ligase